MAQPEDNTDHTPMFTEVEDLPGLDVCSIAILRLENVDYPELIADEWALALQILQNVWRDRRLKSPALSSRQLGGVLVARGCIRMFIEGPLETGDCGQPLCWEYKGVDKFVEMHLEQNYQDFQAAFEAFFDDLGDETEVEVEAEAGS
ncbi:hypothetical protein BO86DRAFT_389263 [Aspergillus japonicus CBS 114.51]|uniref:Uncharacterized protein n=1 Tax=Aspergillus japonicus CBS 114.51 TaxID=1448312 RepID=A0A8T8X2K1_ASPJA|nr:hypothetical protein BO86DRAFT_389263 [Aspergillus japonicus CBS 114.51]RAH81759.1 hypothetical protein BO86DRAFT_389263 [Aspergillus japonicus CBS 114.51]